MQETFFVSMLGYLQRRFFYICLCFFVFFWGRERGSEFFIPRLHLFSNSTDRFVMSIKMFIFWRNTIIIKKQEEFGQLSIRETLLILIIYIIKINKTPILLLLWSVYIISSSRLKKRTTFFSKTWNVLIVIAIVNNVIVLHSNACVLPKVPLVLLV